MMPTRPLHAQHEMLVDDDLRDPLVCPECGHDYEEGVVVFSKVEVKQSYYPDRDEYDAWTVVDDSTETVSMQCDCGAELSWKNEYYLSQAITERREAREHAETAGSTP